MTDVSKFTDRVRTVSLRPNVFNHEQAISAIDELVRAGNGGYVCFSTVHMVMESYDHPEYGTRVNEADIILTDGMPLVWMQKLQGRKDAARVRANDLMIMLMGHAEKEGLKVGFYGGKQEVLDAIKGRVSQDFSNLDIAYIYSPPFRSLTEEEDTQITVDIAASAPDILFMGLGCPKQENWMAAHKDRLKCVMLGVGASFDFYAGNIRESPAWLGKLGLEWLFRLVHEPKRLWRRYLILNPRFMWQAAMQLLKLKSF